MSLPFALHLAERAMVLCFPKYKFFSNLTRFGEAIGNIIYIYFSIHCLCSRRRRHPNQIEHLDRQLNVEFSLL
jgi:hypothetical protein